MACIDFFEISEICRPKFIVRHSTYLVPIFIHNHFESPDIIINLN
jgi:hypothetical protein